jgi:quercetin dioxygenase-like cupin family protein
MKTRTLIVLTIATAALVAIGVGAATLPKDVVGTPLARGAGGELRIRDFDTGFKLRARDATDVAFVKATIAPGGYTGWHGHTGPSIVVVSKGTLTMYQPYKRRCSIEILEAGKAFVHPTSVHNFVNNGTQELEFYIAYFVPAGASPAPIDEPVPDGCPA